MSNHFDTAERVTFRNTLLLTQIFYLHGLMY